MPKPTRSYVLNMAIDQIYSSLPSLLSGNYPGFESELRFLLRNGSDQEVLDLFRPHSAAYNQLLTRALMLAVINNLYGDPLFTTVSTKFSCPIGPHEVEAREADYTPSGEAKCRDHSIGMTPIGQQP